ncbi:flagellar hook-associated protein 3 [Vibrio sp. 10N.286.49.C2]|uniref:flagellar hook-associated protein FlgL n=1 Tax=unclassified Vibrio TaxID=2614977 RepID=UPI000C819E7F|nr:MULTISPECIES: flagellar hook-associated protein FlgL [unclassified Vibrio]PMH38799.1 flagellar hook-associated protein 3 [Vibrio sp. 10N.286.49.C2]PMH55275.1 flagellar hook-associated protein 3 [Vibrio sp. 10N.286.49.B1]PMH83830.1 flagellar hook-associated protein 3 [Vibrio sp. 10N.286.48.B7]
MMNRISSFHSYQTVQNDMRKQENKIHHNQAQLASGKQLQKPADDPLAIHYLQKVGQQTEQLDQFTDAIVLSRNRLEHQEVMIRETEQFSDNAKRLTMESINGALSPEDRGAKARELQELAKNFLALANNQDESGNYTFAGTKPKTQPFFTDNQGKMAYAGDDYQRKMRISNSMEMPINYPGSKLFMEIENPFGDYKPSYQLQNASELLLDKATNNKVNDDSEYKVTFVDMGKAQFGYQLERNGSVVKAGDYDPKAGIEHDGFSLRVKGQITAGDAIVLAPRESFSVFDTFRDAIDALDYDVSDASANAKLHQVTEEFHTAFLHLTKARTDVGVRLNTLDTQEQQNEDFKISLARSKSNFEDLDYSKAVIEFEENSRALQASQLAFGKTKDLTLFNYL